MRSDFRHATRSLLRSPGYTIAAVAALAVGLGATTAVFTLVSAIVLRPLGYPAADQLVSIGHAALRGAAGGLGQSGGTYLFYRENNRVFDDLGVYYENVVNLTDVEDPERIQVAMMSSSIYSTLGVRPVLGRLFNDTDGGGEVPVLISYELWQRRFGADPAIIQRTIGLNASQRRVIGVLPKGFDFPRRETQVWYPDEPTAANADVTDFHYTAIARLKTEVTAADAEAHLNQLLPRIRDSHPAAASLIESGIQATVTPLKDVVIGPVRSALWVLLSSMAVVLLIAFANVGNLMLVRAEHRRREVAVRIALGARAGDLARLFNSESVLIAVGGGLLGLLGAFAGVRLLVLAGPTNIPRLHDVRFDWRVYAFITLLTLLTAVVFGLAPLVRRAG
ncbi:MAG: FtsX-like permease family protein, partial [Gemmatimonadota bacterium]